MTSTTEAPRRFQRDVVWNFLSIAVLAVSGIALNALIGRVYGDSALGVFNQVWAAYVFFSQLAVGGIDLSVLRAVAASSSDRKRTFDVAIGAILPTLALAALSTAGFYLLRSPLARLLESDGVALGIQAATPGLFFFALNKVLFGIQNGLRRMRAFAVLQSCRFLFMLAGFWVVCALGWPGARLAFLFTFAEACLFVLLALEVGLQLAWSARPHWTAWARTHLAYGVKSCLSGVLLELNSRVDILMLGYFLSDAAVGVYSFAALIAEGVFQLLVKLQNVYNPLIAAALNRGDTLELQAMVRKGRVWTWLLMFVVGIVAVLVFPIAVRILTGDPSFQAGWAPFAALMAGIALSSGYMPFQQTLLMANRPGWHTLMVLAMVVINAVGNALLIPHWQLVGSGVATGFALVACVVLLRVLVRRQVGIRI